MPLADLLMERFKVKTRAVQNPKALTAATDTAQLVLGNNPNRLGFLVINLGTKPVFLALTNDVSATKGILLDASGGNFGCIWDEDFDMTAWAWWARCVGDTSAIFALEIVEY